MNEEVTIPTLAKFECPRCQRQTVAESGSNLLCQNCVNEFLATNVGMMQEVVPEPQPDPHEVPRVQPLPPMPDGGGMPPHFPRLEGEDD